MPQRARQSRHPFPLTTRPSHWCHVTQQPQIGITHVLPALIVELLGRTKEPKQQMQMSVSASEHPSRINQAIFSEKIGQKVTNELLHDFHKGPIGLQFGLKLRHRVLVF